MMNSRFPEPNARPQDCGVFFILGDEDEKKVIEITNRGGFHQYFYKMMKTAGRAYALAQSFDFYPNQKSSNRLYMYTTNEEDAHRLCAAFRECIPAPLQQFVTLNVSRFAGLIQEQHLFRLLAKQNCKPQINILKEELQHAFNDEQPLRGVKIKHRHNSSFIINVRDIVQAGYFWNLYQTQSYFMIAGARFRCLLWSESWRLPQCNFCGDFLHFMSRCQNLRCKYCAGDHGGSRCRPKEDKFQELKAQGYRGQELQERVRVAVHQCTNCLQLDYQSPGIVTWGFNHAADDEKNCKHPLMIRGIQKRDLERKKLPSWTKAFISDQQPATSDPEPQECSLTNTDKAPLRRCTTYAQSAAKPREPLFNEHNDRFNEFRQPSRALGTVGWNSHDGMSERSSEQLENAGRDTRLTTHVPRPQGWNGGNCDYQHPPPDELRLRGSNAGDSGRTGSTSEASGLQGWNIDSSKPSELSSTDLGQLGWNLDHFKHINSSLEISESQGWNLDSKLNVSCSSDSDVQGWDVSSIGHIESSSDAMEVIGWNNDSSEHTNEPFSELVLREWMSKKNGCTGSTTTKSKLARNKPRKTSGVSKLRWKK